MRRSYQLAAALLVALICAYFIVIQLIELMACLRVNVANSSSSSRALVNTWTQLNASISRQSTDGLPIPRIIHQTWKTSDLSTYPLKPNSRDYWQLEYPQWQVMLWTDADIDQLIWQEYRWLYATYKAYPYNVERADIARLVFLHKYGGVYVDLDVFPMDFTSDKKVDGALSMELLRSFRCIFPQASDRRTLSNHFVVCEKNSIALMELLQQAPSAMSSLWLPYLHVFASTGPLFVTRVLMQHASLENTFTNHPADMVPSLAILSPSLQWSFLSHQAGRSWLSFDGQVFNWINDHLLLFDLMLFTLLCACCSGLRMAWLKRGRRRYTAAESHHLHTRNRPIAV